MAVGTIAVGTSESAVGTVELENIIRQNGGHRERKRLEEAQQDQPCEQPGALFAADLVLQEESGFELWLGSLEDALSLEALERHKIDGILNCALAECQLECACSRPSGAGRRRSHARGPSAMNGGDFQASVAVDGCRRLDRDQIRALASFDADWYSTILGRDVDYLGIDAVDEPGYPMDAHFQETLDFLARCREEGRRVLVHCVQGINRSSAALVAFLCHDLCMQLADAVELTAKRRGHILSNESFLAQLVERFVQAASPPAIKATL